MKMTIEEFIKRAENVHSCKFDYSLVDYQGSLQKIDIICPTHGVFKQTPNSHINDRLGCKKCYNDMRVVTTDKFITRSNKIHNNQYDYSCTEIVNTQEKVTVICRKHGKFELTANNHLHGRGCPCCYKSFKKTTKQFIIEANEVHNNKFNYNNTVYTTAKNKVEIVCDKHGSFFQTPNDHLSGRGCRKCADLLRRGGYNMEYFKKYPEMVNTKAILYLIRMHNDIEEFYKIGITQSSVKRRYKYNNSYEIDIIEEIDGKLFDLYQIEQLLLKTNSNIQYEPNIKFSGYTECLKERINLSVTIPQ